MPPFILPPYLTSEKKRIRVQRLIHQKNRYSAPVKVHDWEKYEMAKPYDNYPYCPDNYNLLLSHHNRFGNEPSDFTTTTQEMLKQVYTKKSEPIVKPRVNLYTFNRDLPPSDPIVEDYCEDAKIQDYMTEMQDSYEPPYSCLIRRVAMPKKPFMQSRRIKQEPEKFIDDGYHKKCCILQKNNGFRSVSFNPFTSRYTNE